MTRQLYKILLPALVLLVIGCTDRNKLDTTTSPVRQQWAVMGTYAAVTLPVEDAEQLTACADKARDVVADIDAKMSTYKPESEISRLNAAAGESAVLVSDDTAAVLALVAKYWELSDGAFDPTVGPLLSVWGLRGGGKPTTVPSDAKIAEALQLVGYRRVTQRDDGAFIALKGARVDLGGIAKGYAVDLALAAMKELGAKNAMMDLGGNIRCVGEARPGRGWRIGVRNPFDRERILGVIEIPNGMAVATSGNYERFITIGGEKYAHIIDPVTGRPVQGIAGVTVVAATAVEADAMSTALFVAGIEKASEYLKKVPGCAALFIPDEQPVRLIMNKAFSDIYTPPTDLAIDIDVLAE